MPAIIITEKQQAITAANKTEVWSVEENRVDADTGWPTDIVSFDSRGLIRFTIVAEFDGRGFAGAHPGSFVGAVLRHFRFDHGHGGWSHQQQWARTTSDWSEFLGWVNGQSKMFAEVKV